MSEHEQVSEEILRAPWWRRLLRSIGPGFITGAADDDPSGIATYSQAGAQFGYGLLWLAPYTYPFMVAVQELCGRIGLVTGRGLSSILSKHYPRPVLMGAVVLLLIANTVNIGADLGAMAASVQLLAPWLPFTPVIIGVTIAVVLAEILVPYPQYARILKYLTLSLLAYVATALVVGQHWSAVGAAFVLPHITWSHDYLLTIAAFLGTTISPYLFFWQADEEVEEEIVRGQITEEGSGAPTFSQSDLRRMRTDTALGMLFSQIVTIFIILSVAATLGAIGFTHIETAADAAQALRPIAGEFAYLLFALGIIGTGLLAVPVLAGSAGYAVAEAFGWKTGLGKRFGEAQGFYLIIAASTIIGLFVNFSGIGAMTMLYWAAVLNGVLAPPLMLLLIFIGNNKKILGAYTNSSLSNIALGIITLAMFAVSVSLFVF